MKHPDFRIGLAVILGLATVACGPSLEPVGESNATVLRLEADGWRSSDTVYRIDPQTFAQDIEVIESDKTPDTLRDGTIIYQLSEYLPVFAGCEADTDPAICTQTKLNAFVGENLEYPPAARAAGLEGTAVASFVIGPDGKVRNTSIERSLGDRLDRAVLQLIGRMPVWHPGFHKGEPVAVRYKLPVTFSLPEDE